LTELTLTPPWVWQRGWACLILDRLYDLVLPPDDSKGSTLDPDTVAREHHSSFFPDNGHGAASAAGFGWRNGAKVLVCFLYYAIC
jgi:hypothetical protein